MSHPTPLATAVEEHWMEHELMWRQALADNHISDAEGKALYAYRSKHLSPRIPLLTQTMHAIGSLARGSEGVESPRFVRTCREWWQRRNAPQQSHQA